MSDPSPDHRRPFLSTGQLPDRERVAALIRGHQPRVGRTRGSPAVCHDVMAVIATAGMYDTSGDWLWDVGLPGKSGISGAVSSPRADSRPSSVSTSSPQPPGDPRSGAARDAAPLQVRCRKGRRQAFLEVT
jgi:hypothetical protein